MTSRQPSRKSILLLGTMLALAATLSGLFAPEPPTVAEVARAALGPTTEEPPDRVEGLPGYEAVGVRSDTVAGRGARTVVLRSGSTEVRDAIVDGRPLDLPGAERVTVRDLELAPAAEADFNLVAWHADGRTRILFSRDLGTDALVALLRRA